MKMTTAKTVIAKKEGRSLAIPAAVGHLALKTTTMARHLATPPGEHLGTE